MLYVVLCYIAGIASATSSEQAVSFARFLDAYRKERDIDAMVQGGQLDLNFPYNDTIAHYVKYSASKELIDPWLQKSQADINVGLVTEGHKPVDWDQPAIVSQLASIKNKKK